MPVLVGVDGGVIMESNSQLLFQIQWAALHLMVTWSVPMGCCAKPQNHLCPPGSNARGNVFMNVMVAQLYRGSWKEMSMGTLEWSEFHAC